MQKVAHWKIKNIREITPWAYGGQRDKHLPCVPVHKTCGRGAGPKAGRRVGGAVYALRYGGIVVKFNYSGTGSFRVVIFFRG